MTDHLHDVPTLDALTQDPLLVTTLSPEVARTLLPGVAGLQALLLVQCAKTTTVKPSTQEDSLIDKDAVAALIGMSVSWVEKHPDDLPPRRSLAGNPRWLKSEVMAWLKNRPVYGG